MKSSLLLAVTGALLDSASPLRNMEKRAVKTVTQVVYATDVSEATVTLAPGQEPPAATPAPAKFKETPARLIDVDDSLDPPPNIFSKPHPDEDDYSESAPTPAPAPQPAPSKPAPPPANSYGGPPAGNLDDYAKSMLEKHNEARNAFKVPALKWNNNLAQEAKNPAKNCILTHDNSGKSFGQNMAWLWTSDQGGSAAKVGIGGVQDWYNEKEKFAGLYGQPDVTGSIFSSVVHFTQMVWKDTNEVGCATYRCSTQKVDWVTVCNYKKPGNVAGQYAEMVPRPT